MRGVTLCVHTHITHKRANHYKNSQELCHELSSCKIRNNKWCSHKINLLLFFSSSSDLLGGGYTGILRGVVNIIIVTIATYTSKELWGRTQLDPLSAAFMYPKCLLLLHEINLTMPLNRWRINMPSSRGKPFPNFYFTVLIASGRTLSSPMAGGGRLKTLTNRWMIWLLLFITNSQKLEARYTEIAGKTRNECC